LLQNKNLCIKLVNYWDYAEIHGQQNIKKIVPVLRWNITLRKQKRMEVQLQTFLALTLLDGRGQKYLQSSRLILGERTGTHLMWGWTGPKPGHSASEKIQLLSLPGIESRFLGLLLIAYSLYSPSHPAPSV